ncbi:MAG: Uma2 family endonuclease [Planctomycetota bacterium]|nr:Uma2 family endonuclease [Planctomycetota bacterium]
MPLRLEEPPLAPCRPHPGRTMTEAEFVAWCDEEIRAEWVDGEVIVIAPDNTWHNRIVLFLYSIISGVVEAHGRGTVMVEGIQMRFAKLRRRRQPDIIFIAKERQHIIKTNHVEGPPDLAVEVISPDSPARDYRDKYQEYEAAGVREYWIVDPLAQRVEAYALGRNGRYTPIPERDGRIPSRVLPHLYIKPAWLWREPLPNWLRILRELGALKK